MAGRVNNPCLRLSICYRQSGECFLSVILEILTYKGVSTKITTMSEEQVCIDNYSIVLCIYVKFPKKIDFFFWVAASIVIILSTSMEIPTD